MSEREVPNFYLHHLGCDRRTWYWHEIEERDAGRILAVLGFYRSLAMLRKLSSKYIHWPVLLELQQNLSRPVVVVEFCINEGRQVRNAVDLRLLDIQHPSVYILARLFIFGLLGPELFLQTKVVLLCLLQFGL